MTTAAGDGVDHVAREARGNLIAAFAVDAAVEDVPVRLRAASASTRTGSSSSPRPFGRRLERRQKPGRPGGRRVAERDDADRRGMRSRGSDSRQWHYFVNSSGDAARSFCSRADTFSTSRITRRMFRPRIFLIVVVLVAAAEELGGERRILRDVFESLDDAGDAVEVAAETDVIDAGDLPDVIDVVGGVGDRRARGGVGFRPRCRARVFTPPRRSGTACVRRCRSASCSLLHGRRPSARGTPARTSPSRRRRSSAAAAGCRRARCAGRR